MILSAKFTVSRLLYYFLFLVAAHGVLIFLYHLASFTGLTGDTPFVRGWVRLIHNDLPPALQRPDGVKIFQFGRENALLIREFPAFQGFFEGPVLLFLLCESLTWLIGLGVLFQLGLIFRNLHRRQFFVPENVRRMRLIAAGVAALPVFRYGAESFLVRVLNARREFNDLFIAPAHHLELLAALWVIALFLFALVEIFRTGQHLQHEQDLTV